MSQTGIYCIKNLVNGKMYIGSTSQPFKTRFYQHKNSLVKNKHGNCILQRAWNKYGEASFSFQVLEPCSEQLNAREQHYFDSLKPAYNIEKFAYQGMRGRTHKPETIAKIKAHGPAPLGKKGSFEHRLKCVKAHGSGWVVCRETGEMFLGHAEAERTLGITNGKRNTAKGYTFFQLEII